jgi:polygalacturonase
MTSLSDFGAVSDGKTLNTEPIQSAIDHLASKGGGTLAIPHGVFRSGALFLKPGVHLHLDDGAVLKGSTDTRDYPARVTRIEGHFEEWLPALINADHTDHLRIGGAGTLDDPELRGRADQRPHLQGFGFLEPAPLQVP